MSPSSPPSPLCSRRCCLATTQSSWTRTLRLRLQSACIIVLFASSSLLLRPLVVSAVGPADAIVVVALSQSSLSLSSLPPPSENCSFVGGGCRIREEEQEQDERVHLHLASEFRVLMRSLHSFVPLQVCGFDGSKNGCFAHKSTPPTSANTAVAVSRELFIAPTSVLHTYTNHLVQSPDEEAKRTSPRHPFGPSMALFFFFFF